jgi:hypothetical protein
VEAWWKRSSKLKKNVGNPKRKLHGWRKDEAKE